MSAYPLSDDAELWAAVLWAGLRADQLAAVLSDDTALSLYDVSTISPVDIDLTVPKGTRVRRMQTPDRYKMHLRDYAPPEVTRVRGLPATTLARTLLDLVLDQRALQFVDEALEQGAKRGLLTSRESSTLRGLRAADPALLDAVRRS